MGCGCNKAKAAVVEKVAAQSGITLAKRALPATIADRSSFVVYDRSLEMISAQRVEELLKMPFALSLHWPRWTTCICSRMF